MVKWIGGVLALVGLSLMTSGLVSALIDLAAFLLLLFVVARRAMKRKAESAEKGFSDDISGVEAESKERIDITP
ncbi:hypothetical protein [Photobacterium alginatilyticum]|uniref:Uncharacterized protein n=1 Tax=Photobacterium alginatilyticum TaxID=1775171 RepID=A0ABW9YEL6_9GAMM|nr:hypothetical protein [Photobacterium alginatilyticum]NBI52076.1 hypothetical protein [Photobacterium alginatilyticum]